MKIIMETNSQNAETNTPQVEPQKQEENKIEVFNGEFLHPSLDIKDNILTVGFRYRSKPNEEKNIFIVVVKGSVQTIDVDSFTIEEKTYYFEKRNRKLMRMEEK